MYYILSGHEAVEVHGIVEWGRWFETADRVVKKDTVGDVEVSTVFLGMDHSFGGRKPLLFETMIFGGGYDQSQWRYSTWGEAVAGHREAVLLVGKEPE